VLFIVAWGFGGAAVVGKCMVVFTVLLLIDIAGGFTS
jgi:hypothetical protein